MKKFIVFIYPQGESIFNLPVRTQQNHIQKVGTYLGQLKEKGLLLEAQPLQPVGTMISGNKIALTVETVNQTKIAGFYMIQSKNEENLIEVLKQDPRFEDTSWKLEIREVLKMI